MSTHNQTEEITALIRSLEEKRKSELSILKAQLHLTGESMKPANLLKSAANELTHNKTVKSYLIQAGIGLILGLVTKKIINVTQNHSRPKNIFGNLAEAGLNKLTFNGPAIVKIAAPIVFGLIANAIKNRRRKHEPVSE
jgi:ElaB/YqjD/DUF883 family membrane-anchored ribosome-binding protein